MIYLWIVLFYLSQYDSLNSILYRCFALKLSKWKEEAYLENTLENALKAEESWKSEVMPWNYIKKPLRRHAHKAMGCNYHVSSSTCFHAVDFTRIKRWLLNLYILWFSIHCFLSCNFQYNSWFCTCRVCIHIHSTFHSKRTYLGMWMCYEYNN